jgi:hypothetical protein
MGTWVVLKPGKEKENDPYVGRYYTMFEEGRFGSWRAA